LTGIALKKGKRGSFVPFLLPCLSSLIPVLGYFLAVCLRARCVMFIRFRDPRFDTTVRWQDGDHFSYDDSFVIDQPRISIPANYRNGKTGAAVTMFYANARVTRYMLISFFSFDHGTNH